MPLLSIAFEYLRSLKQVVLFVDLKRLGGAMGLEDVLDMRHSG